MQWEVTGADRATGADRTLTIEAADEASATRRGNRQGLLVASVRPLLPEDSLAGNPAPVIPYATPTAVAAPPDTPQFVPGMIICPNPACGYVGYPKEVRRGSTAVGCLLMFLMLVPGVIYFIVRSGRDCICPRCGIKIR